MTGSSRGLIADIGGTNARFAIADETGYHDELTLKCDDYPGPVEAVRDYLQKAGIQKAPRSAYFATAGVLKGDSFALTNNLKWTFSIKAVKQELGLDVLGMMNDFQAIALAVPHLQSEDLHKIAGGPGEAHAPIGVIGPGTGLGVASLVWGQGRYFAVPGEGGHVTMPARTQREFDIFQQLLQDKYSHISAERVCSGKGLVNLYEAIRMLDGLNDLPDKDPEEISRDAIAGSCPVCREAVDLMCVFLGRVAGNLAVTLGAFGGIYIAGGIVSKLGDYFFQSGFYEEFTNKGRYKEYLESVPVQLITHSLPAFVGLHAEVMAAPLPRP